MRALPNSPIEITSFALALFICLCALFLGRNQEKFGGLTYLIGWALSLLALSFGGEWRYKLLLTIDLVVFLCFISQCWKSPTSWPFWASLALGINLSLLGVIQQLHLSAWYFLSLSSAMSHCVLLALGIGTLGAARSKRKIGLATK